MTFTEILRMQTRETRDAFKLCTDTIKRTGRQHKSELIRIEILQRDIEQKNFRLEQINNQVNNIQNQIEDLLNQQQSLQNELYNLEEERLMIYKEKHTAHNISEKLQHKIQQLVNEKLQIKKKQISKQRDAIRFYIEGLEGRLVDRVTTQERISERVMSQKKFEKARHEDPEVMRLWEERLELKNLLEMARVSTIRGQLTNQIKKIEREIDSRFPGVLQRETNYDNNLQTEEIFFFSNGSNKLYILLPITPKKWMSLQTGIIDVQASSTLRLIWAIAGSLGLNGKNARIYNFCEFFTLEISKDLFESSEHTNISMPLPGNGEVSFVLSKLPKNIMEAIRHEDSH
jgi:hypothetical protein